LYGFNGILVSSICCLITEIDVNTVFVAAAFSSKDNDGICEKTNGDMSEKQAKRML